MDLDSFPLLRVMIVCGARGWKVILLRFLIYRPFGVVQLQSLNVGGSPLDLTYLPYASKVYVTIPNANKTVVLNANLDIVERNITHAAIQGPMGVSVSSDGQHIFVKQEYQRHLSRSPCFSGPSQSWDDSCC